MKTPKADWILDGTGHRLMRGKKSSRRGLVSLCDALPSGLTGLEIGSFAGESAEIFMASGKFACLHCVDPWMDEQEKTHKAEARFDERHGSDPRVVKHKGVLRDCFRALPDFDFIYIDGDHNYVPVMRDIGQAMLLLKPGGILAGHDYGQHCPGVVHAVNEYFGQVRTFKDSSWLVTL